MSQVPLSHILVVSTALFFIGMYGLLTRRNLITMLMSVELILNSVNINFVAFNRYLYADRLDGVFFTLFIVAIAAAEAAVAIAIIINLYRNFKSIDVEAADEMLLQDACDCGFREPGCLGRKGRLFKQRPQPWFIGRFRQLQ